MNHGTVRGGRVIGMACWRCHRICGNDADYCPSCGRRLTPVYAPSQTSAHSEWTQYLADNTKAEEGQP